MSAHHKQLGFTLLETIIYIGLFGLIFSGIFVSIYPFMVGSERISQNIAREGEVAFILRKIQYNLSEHMTSVSDVATLLPSVTNTETTLTTSGNDFIFQQEVGQPFLRYGEGGSPTQRLNAQRVKITNFSVTHPTPASGAPHHLEVTFQADGEVVGPVLFYLHF